MDKDSEVEEKRPEYAYHYKDAEARKAYQREYQLRRYYEKIKPKKEKDNVKEKLKGESANMEEAKTPNLSEGIGIVTDLLGKDDPIANAIKKYEKPIMLGLQLLKGFAENMNAYNAQKQSNKPQQQGPQPPEGWLGSSALQRMNRKYLPNGNINPWYAQGLAYENASSGVQGVSYNPVDMEATRYGSMEAERQRHNSRDTTMSQKSMADLERESNKWDQKPATQNDGMNIATAKEVERTDKQPKSINEALKLKEEQKQKDIDVPNAEETLQNIGEKLMEDAAKYLNLIKVYFQNRTLKDFEKDLRNVDKTIVQYESMVEILPYQAKEAFKSLSFEDWEKLIVDADPDKLILIEKKKLKPKLKKLIEQLKNKL